LFDFVGCEWDVGGEYCFDEFWGYGVVGDLVVGYFVSVCLYYVDDVGFVGCVVCLVVVVGDFIG